MNREVTTGNITALRVAAFVFDTLGMLFDLIPIADLFLVPIVNLFAMMTLGFMVASMFPSWAISDVFFSGRGLGKGVLASGVKFIPLLGGLIPAYTLWAVNFGSTVRQEAAERGRPANDNAQQQSRLAA